MSRLAVLAMLLVGCRTTQHTAPEVLAALRLPGQFIAGPIVALNPPLVLNREDFVYDAQLSPDGTRLAVARLGSLGFHLSLFALEADGPKLLADPKLNGVEHDVEGVAFSPDGAQLAAISRDGAVRVFEARAGASVATTLTDEPLVSVAWGCAGACVAVGSAKGLITLLSFPGLEVLAEVRAHTDEVRALAFSGQSLVSGGWDRRLLRFSVEPDDEVKSVRAHVEKKGGQRLTRVAFDHRASAVVALDARAPMVLIKPALATALGITELGRQTSVPSAFGAQIVKVSGGHLLQLKRFELGPLDIGVCEACVPPEAQAVLGGPALEALSLAFDEATNELVATAGAELVRVLPGRRLVLEKTHQFPAAINDLSLDASGTRAAVAFSQTKAERTREVYQREKRNELEPEREWDCAALISLGDGAVLQKVHGHRGVVSSAAVTPDGQTLVSAGWDKRVLVHRTPPLIEDDFKWSVRRVRVSRDGRFVVVAAWTPANPVGDHRSAPAAMRIELIYGAGASVTTAGAPGH